MDKYELTNRSKTVVTPYGEAMVYQIKALIDLPDIGVKVGDFGGYIGDEDCLGQINACWVFEGSSVTRGSRVKNRAQIKGNSMVTGNSVVRGTAVVIHSKILSGSTVQGSSSVKYSDLSEKCIISGASNVEYSRLRKVKLVNGKIVTSTVQSLTDAQLIFEKQADIEECDLDLQADAPFVMKAIQMKKVVGIDIVKFSILEKTVMTNVVFEGETSIAVGKPNSPLTNITNLIGGEEGLLLDGVELSMKNSSVVGDGLLKGKIELINSHVSDCIHIENDTDENLHLVDCTVRDCAVLRKTLPTGRGTILNEQYFSGDVIVER